MATSWQSRFGLRNATLHPPALPTDDDGADIPWVLLDEHAYVADCRNATTASTTTWDEKDIQVTFCLARPPSVSYICVFCPGRDHTEFPLEPKILAMEEDLVLLRIIVSSRKDVFKDTDYYIYQAADRAAGGGPSLKRLPRPPRPYAFESFNVGILRCRTNHVQHHEDRSRSVLQPHRDTTDDAFYVVAGLCTARNAKPEEFILCHYSSKVPTHWSTDRACVSLTKRQLLQHGCYFHHANSKVITIGGDAGTMGFVDLWQGILFFDVLKAVEGTESAPVLRYVLLPPPLQPDVVPRGDARLARDIAVVKDQEGHMMIKYVELQVHGKPGQGFRGSYAIGCWVTRTWEMPVSATNLEDGWVEDCRLESSLIHVENSSHFELLPKVLDHEGKPLPPFMELDIGQPTLSLHDDDGIVCFMIKKNRGDAKAWVIAVGMRENTLHSVSEFAAERTVDVTFAYVHSRISKYLKTKSLL